MSVLDLTVEPRLVDVSGLQQEPPRLRRRKRSGRMLAAGADTALAAGIAGLFWLLPFTSTSLLELLIVLAGWPLALAAAGAYHPRALRYPSDEARSVLQAALGLLLVTAAGSYLLGAQVGRDLLLGLLPLLFITALAMRALLRRVTGRALSGTRSGARLLAVGDESQVLALISAFGSAAPREGAVVGAVVDAQDGRVDLDLGLPLVQGLDRIKSAIELTGADAVVVGAGRLSPTDLRKLAWALEDYGVDLLVAPGLLDVDRHRLSVRVTAGVPLIDVTEGSLHGMNPLRKDIFDRVVAAAVLLVAVPLVIAPIALLLKLLDPGPVFFRHERLGRHGRPFGLYKFRTMKTAYSGRSPEHVFVELGRADLLQEWVHHQKLREDPRVTALGRFLRQTSLDELPQLLNVLRGELSLVGPRPIVAEELERFGDNSSRILACKPGITGMWQVAGRNDLSYDERVRLNVYYVDNWRLFLDVKLLVKTAAILLTRKGAF